MVSQGGRPNPRALLCLCGLKNRGRQLHMMSNCLIWTLGKPMSGACGGISPLSGGWERSLGGGLAAGPHAAHWALMTVSVWIPVYTHMQRVLSVSLSACLSQCFIRSPSREIWKLPGPRGSWAPMSTERPHALSFTFPLVIFHLSSILRRSPCKFLLCREPRLVGT